MNSEKTHDIVIRSYHKDIPWLMYALKSIHKYVTGFRQVVIIVPENQLSQFQELNLTKEILKTCPVYEHDYVGQQITKLTAHLYTDSDLITFWDSDLIAFTDITPNDYVFDNKPILYKTDYKELVGQGDVWKHVTERAVQARVEFEYMRRIPLTYLRETFPRLGHYFQKVHGKSVEQYMLEITNNHFSEFNALGAFIALNEPELYEIQNTAEINLPPVKAKQYWSWGGISQEIQTEIDSFLV